MVACILACAIAVATLVLIVWRTQYRSPKTTTNKDPFPYLKDLAGILYDYGSVFLPLGLFGSFKQTYEIASGTENGSAMLKLIESMLAAFRSLDRDTFRNRKYSDIHVFVENSGVFCQKLEVALEGGSIDTSLQEELEEFLEHAPPVPTDVITKKQEPVHHPLEISA